MVPGIQDVLSEVQISMKKSKKINHYIRLACLTGALFCYSASAFAEVMPNTQLPVNGQWIMGGPNSNIINPNDTVMFDNNTMNIKQEEINAVINGVNSVLALLLLLTLILPTVMAMVNLTF